MVLEDATLGTEEVHENQHKATCKQGSPSLNTGEEKGHSQYLYLAKPSCWL